MAHGIRETCTTDIVWVECDKYSERSIKSIIRGQRRGNILPSGLEKIS